MSMATLELVSDLSRAGYLSPTNPRPWCRTGTLTPGPGTLPTAQLLGGRNLPPEVSEDAGIGVEPSSCISGCGPGIAAGRGIWQQVNKRCHENTEQKASTEETTRREAAIQSCLPSNARSGMQTLSHSRWREGDSNHTE